LNYIFENDLYNRPQYIKNKRGRRDFSSSSDSLSTHSQSPQPPPQPPVSLEEFEMHIHQWGAQIMFKNQIVRAVNTCSIDYYLLALWYLFKIKYLFFSDNIPLIRNLRSIVNDIDIYEWDKAREKFILNILNYNEAITNRTISLFGTQYGRFVRFFMEYQKHYVIRTCNVKCQLNNTNLSESDHIYFEKENNTLNFTFRTAAPKNCGLCQSLLTLNVQFINSPNFLFIESLLNNIYISDFPETVFLDNKIFKLLCVTIVRGNHFTAIFKLNNKYYLVDDLGRLFKEIDTSIPKRGQAAFYPSTCSLYYLE